MAIFNFRPVKSVVGSVAAVVLSASLAFGQGVPTTDTGNTLQTIKQLEELLKNAGVQSDILDNAMEQLTALENQLTQLKDMYGKLTGLRDIAGLNLGDGLDGLLTSDMTDILSVMKAGAAGDWSGLASGKSQALQKSITSALSNAGMTQNDVTTMASSGIPGRERTATQASSGATLAATAQQTYTDAGTALTRTNKIIDLTKQSEDVKESIDLNTRMLADVVVVLAKSLELQSAEAIYSGQAGVLSAADIAEERAYMTFSNE